MDIVKRIKKLKDDKGWTTYRLSLESGVSANTIHNWWQKKSVPTVALLKQICDSLGVTLSYFFSDGNLVELTPCLKTLVDKWQTLTKEERTIVQSVIDGFADKK